MQNAILANVAVVQSHCLPLPLPLALALALAHCIPLALAMPQFKCRLTHCDAIASFLPFCFLSQIVCALEQAKVEHVSALPLSTCHLPPGALFPGQALCRAMIFCLTEQRAVRASGKGKGKTLD